ncbi:MAG: UbiA family prenyltransferase [Bacteroidales bacterium]|nr:UbiA family prenyltransferase [Bacteroidales bacterium]
MKSFLNLIRWKSVILCLIALFVVRFFLIESFYQTVAGGVISSLSILEYIIFCLSILLIVIASVLINEYFDQDIDKINKAEKDIFIGKFISEKRVLNLFYILSAIGVLIGYIVGYLNGFLHLGSLLIAIACISYFYSLKYKRQFIVGNLVVAFLYSMIIFLPILFELFSLMKVQPEIFKIIIHPLKEQLLPITILFTAITFVLTFIREVIGDMQDEEGDREGGCRSFAIVLGEKKTKYIVIAVTLLLIPLIYFLFYYYESYVSFLIVALIIYIPLIFFLKELRKAKAIQDYGFLSELLKMVYVSCLFAITMLKF